MIGKMFNDEIITNKMCELATLEAKKLFEKVQKEGISKRDPNKVLILNSGDRREFCGFFWTFCSSSNPSNTEIFTVTRKI